MPMKNCQNSFETVRLVLKLSGQFKNCLASFKAVHDGFTMGLVFKTVTNFVLCTPFFPCNVHQDFMKHCRVSFEVHVHVCTCAYIHVMCT